MKFNEFCQRLQAIKELQGNNAKQLELEKLLVDTYVFVFAILKDEKYNVSEKVMSKAFITTVNATYEDFGELLRINHDNKSNELTFENILLILENVKKYSGKDLINKLRFYLSCMSSIEACYFFRILNGNLRIGVSNAKILEIIEEKYKLKYEKIEVMLCDKINTPTFFANTQIDEYCKQNWLKVIGKCKLPFGVEEKYDGMRCILTRQNNKCSLISRANSTIDYAPEIIEWVENQMTGNFILDGEIYCNDFAKLQTRIGRKDKFEPIENLQFRCYDILKYNNIDATQKTQIERKRLITGYIGGMIKESAMLLVEKEEDFVPFYKQILLDGKEGVVIKDLNAVYTYGSRDAWNKCKPIREATFEIVDAYYGSGKNKDTIGGLKVKSKNDVESNVGSGFSDETRALLLQLYSTNQLKGKFVDIEYFAISQNKDGSKSLRFPVYLKLRDDKLEADVV